MTDDQLYEIPDFQGQGDYLPDSTLEKMGPVVARIPLHFENPSTQAYKNCVMAKIEFPVVGPFAQEEALEYALHAVTLVRTLYANLLAARAQLARRETS